MRLINCIARCQAIYRSSGLDSPEITGCRHSFVLAICQKPGMTQEQLARHLCLNKSSVARHIALLEEAGYIKREEDITDKRAFHIFPTEKMSGIYPKVRELTDSWNKGITEGISEDELAVFYSVLSRLDQGARRLSGIKEDEE